MEEMSEDRSLMGPALDENYVKAVCVHEGPCSCGVRSEKDSDTAS